MSLEKRKGSKEKHKEKELEGSSFRRVDFTPLQEIKAEKGELQIEPEPLIEVLTEIEVDVLDIAKDILKLKRYDSDFEIDVSEAELQKYPIIEKLYAKSIAKLAYKKGYSKEEIFLAIRSLEEKNWIVTKERRTKLEILNNKKLTNILEFIKKNPGIHARNKKIEDELGITRTPFLKHIMTLERFKLIRSKRIGKSLHYFLADVPEDYDKFKVVFTNPLIPKIIEEIFKAEGISITKIGEELEVYSGTIQYHLKKLKELDIIKSVKNQKNQKMHVVNIELLKKFNTFFGEPDFTTLLNGL